MASAYGTFANSGVSMTPIGIRRVIDPDGNVLIDNTAAVGRRVMSAAVADNVTDVLRDVVTDGTGPRAAVSGHSIAGKTGTAQAYRAAWFVGYTPSLATAVWMGHADRLDSLYGVNGVGRVTGGSHPAIAFSQFMSAALAGTPDEGFPVPGELEDPVETSEEVVVRRQEATVIGGRSSPQVLVPNCGGPCEGGGLPAPPMYAPPATVPNGPPDPDNSTSTTASGSGEADE